jgi:hypothetical protein
MPIKDPEKRRQYDRERKRRIRAEKRQKAEIQKHKLTEHQLAKRNEKDLISTIAETNKLPKVPFSPEEIKEFGRDLGKPLKQSFFEDKPKEQPTSLTCTEIQRKLRNYLDLSMSEKSHISNCDGCSMVYAVHRRTYGVKSLW